MFNTGARVSEIVGLHIADLRLTAPCAVLLRGKGSKERTCPIWPKTAGLLRRLIEQYDSPPSQSASLFLNDRGARLTRFGVRLILNKYVEKAALRLPSLTMKRLHPHSVRHSLAMSLLQRGVDITVIALWLGHESIETTQAYLHADMAMKEKALARTINLNTKPKRYRPNDRLLAYLESL
jgi:site-specific recombinase XerD